MTPGYTLPDGTRSPDAPSLWPFGTRHATYPSPPPEKTILERLRGLPGPVYAEPAPF